MDRLKWTTLKPQALKQQESEIKLTFQEKCFAGAFLLIAVGLPCILCWVCAPLCKVTPVISHGVV